MKTENYKCFTHKKCEYFPCHTGIPVDDFNCLFCYCPLYMLGDNCGGNFSYTSQGIKDCSNCGIPHSKAGYDFIMNGYQKMVMKMSEDKLKQNNILISKSK